MASPLNLQYVITTSYLFSAAVAMCLRTMLDEALDAEVEEPHADSINFFVNLWA